jgi:alpha-L-rhamnosidase
MTQRLRPDFIWTPCQPVDPKGSRATYLGLPPRDDGKNRWFFFRRTFDLPGKPNAGELSITVDGRYRLFVNGLYTGRGPVRANPLFQRFDTYEISDKLRQGENAIAVLVHTYGVDTAFYETTRGMWQPTFGDGGLWVDGFVDMAERRMRIVSDEGWRCTESHAWTQDTPRSNHSLGFIEDLDGNQLDTDWIEPDYDDSDWDRSRAMIAGGGPPESPYGGYATRPFPILLPRGIPHQEERRVAAQRIVWTRGLIADPTLPFHKRCYEEVFAPAPDSSVHNASDLLRLENGNATIKTAPGRDLSILLDFGKIMTGHPRIEVEARGGEIVEIACSESLPGEYTDAGIAPDARPTPNPWLGLDTHLSRYQARAGRQVFERFEWCAIRWVQLTVRNAPDGLTVRGFGANIVNYPVEERGRFEASDPMLGRLWKSGAYTLRQCMHDAWEDCPSREQRQWLGDVTVENLVGHAAFGPCIAPLTRKFLHQVAESQRPDGLTQMFAPGDHKVNGTLIPDWTLQWILTAADHWRHTGDRETIEEIYPSILKALAWFERLIDVHGLVADMPYWHFMDWAGLGRQGEAGALNAQLSGSFRAAALLGRVVGWESAAARLEARAEAIAAALEARHWDERRKVYVDIVDPSTGEQDLRVSQHTNAAIALWGAPRAGRIGPALDRITDSRRLTFTAAPPIAPHGEILEPREGVVLANTFYSHFLYEALAKHGRFDDTLRLIRERYVPMLERGATTLWESFAPTASLCHGFSATPTYQLTRRVLGIAPAKPGFAEVTFAPDIAGLEFAQGVVPSPRGDISVRLERTSDGFVATANASMPVRVAAAPGYTCTTTTQAGDRVEARFRFS